LLAANALWYPLRYPGEFQTQAKEPTTLNARFHYHYPAPEDIQQILSLRTFRDFGGGSLYDDSFGFIDQNPHNTLHLWTGGQNPDYIEPTKPTEPTKIPLDANYRNRGVTVSGRQFHRRDDLHSQPMFGDMFSNLTASYDPVFWPVHSNIDRIWWEWQQSNPHSLPEDLDSVLTPWAYTVRETLDMRRFGYEYVKATAVMRVGTHALVGRFTSKPIAIPDFARAEVRLHRVPQLPRSCFIRVFLNEPTADAQTPLDLESYAGYLAVFGHGPCIGGPGHCDLPPREARPFDRRQRSIRSMNTPRNYRVDVTRCIRNLLKKNATEVTVTLVVIGVDYQEDRDLLRLGGVSLNFFD
jgi:tyrosinase